MLQPNQIRAYMALRCSAPMPEPILDSNGVLDNEADNAALVAWSNTSVPDPVTMDEAMRFCDSLSSLIDNLLALEVVESEPHTSQYMTVFYDAAKAAFDGDRGQIRVYFRMLYVLVFHREEGPRWGDFVDIYGREAFVNLLQTRISELNQLLP